jgi:hypothetical protein
MQAIFVLSSCNYFHLSIMGGLCEQLQGKCNTCIFFSFEDCDGQMGVNHTITRQVDLVGWCLVGSYLGD